MFDRIADLESRYEALEERLADPGLPEDRKEFSRVAKERADLVEVVTCYREWRRLEQEVRDNRELLDDGDPEIRNLAAQELAGLKERQDAMEQQLRILLLPRDPNDARNVLLEIRAGTGGEEASLFCADLFRMYSRYAEVEGWKVEVLSSSPTGLGGFREIVALIEGRGAYSHLKFEGGVHRVQRVPVTEASGRIHTSAVTVAVLPEADEVDVAIDPRELRIDVFRSSGPGGQSVNTTDSAVRITHLPTGLVVSCQDEKSQHKNKAKGLKILRARLLEKTQEAQRSEIAASRKLMVGSGDRSERVRTYNFPQGRVTDHRIHLTLYKLDQIMDGGVSELIDGLITRHRAEVLQAAG